MRFSALLTRILIALLVVLLGLPVSAGFANPPEQNTPVPLDQAILNGQIDVKATPNQPGMSQPNILLTITVLTGDQLAIEIAAGTILAPMVDRSYSSVIIPDSQVVQVNQKLDVEISTFSLSSDLLQPTNFSPVDYRFSTIYTDTKLLNLFQISRDNHYGYGYDIQLAVWATSENKTIAEIIEKMTTKPPKEVQDRAYCMLEGRSDCTAPLPPPTQGPTLAPSNTPAELTQLPTTTEGQNRGGSGIWIFLGLALLLVAIVAVIVVLGMRKDKNKTGSGTGWDVEVTPKPKPPAPQPQIPGKPLPTPPDPPIPTVPPPQPANITRARLTASEGAHKGKTLIGTFPFILSRSDLKVAVISEATISAPHAMFDLAETGVEVKDMNSSNGIVVSGVRLQPGWQRVEPGQHVLLGKAEFAFDAKTFHVLSGDAAGSFYGPFDDPVVISREPFNVVRLGAADGNISDAHVLFYKVDDHIQIRDLSSRSGTRVNGIEAARNQILHPGDRIQLGMSEFIFQSE